MPLNPNDRSPTRIPDARVAEYFHAVCKYLNDHGGSAKKSEILTAIQPTLHLTDSERSRNKSGYERWRVSIAFNFITYQKAQFLRRGGGIWQLLEPGRDAMANLSPLEMLEAAREKYAEWHADREESDDESDADDTRPDAERVASSPGRLPRIWLIGTGKDGSEWRRFLTNGEIGIDFAHGGQQIGDLGAMSRDAIHRRICELTGDRNPRNDSLACTEFAQEIRPGDIVIARTGVARLLGIGRITGEYRFQPNATGYAHTRKVEWIDTHERMLPDRVRLPIKTLTEMSRYPDVVDLLLGKRSDIAVTCLESQGHDSGSIDAFFRQRPYEVEFGPIESPGIPTGLDDRPTLESMLAESFGIGKIAEEAIAALRLKGAVMLQGAPGTGKTHLAQKLALHYAGSPDRVVRVQFHPAYSYEDFVRGVRPSPDGRGFCVQDGPLVRIAKAAERAPGENFVLFIDEFNRGNVAKIMGETLSLIELDKRGKDHGLDLGLPVNGSFQFWLPRNVAVLATMNTADRSIALVDYALRRRFAFITIKSAYGDPEFSEWLADRLGPGRTESGTDRDRYKPLVQQIVERLSAMNGLITTDRAFGPGYAIGHSFFCSFDPGSATDPVDWARGVFEREIRPLIEEYCVEHPALCSKLVDLIPAL